MKFYPRVSTVQHFRIYIAFIFFDKVLNKRSINQSIKLQLYFNFPLLILDTTAFINRQGCMLLHGRLAQNDLFELTCSKTPINQSSFSLEFRLVLLTPLHRIGVSYSTHTLARWSIIYAWECAVGGMHYGTISGTDTVVRGRSCDVQGSATAATVS